MHPESSAADGRSLRQQASSQQQQGPQAVHCCRRIEQAALPLLRQACVLRHGRATQGLLRMGTLCARRLERAQARH